MLMYVGGGFIPLVPARDLSDEEVKKYGGEKKLLATGLYQKPKETTAEKAKEKEGD